MSGRLCDELGKTVILVLHEINYAAFYSDYICAIDIRIIAKFDTVKEVMTKEVLSGIYHVDFEIMEIQVSLCPFIIKPVTLQLFTILKKENIKHKKIQTDPPDHGSDPVSWLYRLRSGSDGDRDGY